MSEMVPNPQSYFKQWIPSRSELLKNLEAEALKEQIPIIGPVLGHFLDILARLTQAKDICELGTATGYSTIHLAHACRANHGRVITLDHDKNLAERARNNIDKAGLADFVEVRNQDAIEALSNFDGLMDMVFMDIEKQDYVRALPSCKAILRSGGLLVADNTGFRDADPFNRAIYDDPDWRVVNLWAFWPGHSPHNDGLCLALKS
jgi:caffeoyl-CoA O-methyltransferase